MITLVILFSLKTMETPGNGLQPPSWRVIAELLQLNVELGSVYIKHQRQFCPDASDSVLIEINGGT